MYYKKRIIEFPHKVSFFLIGVRGSGKTALLKRLFPEALYIDLLDETLYQSYLSDVSLFYEKVHAFKHDGLVIVDEIQRMPRLLNEVHRLIEVYFSALYFDRFQCEENQEIRSKSFGRAGRNDKSASFSS